MTPTPERVLLRNTQLPASFDREHVYFAFGSGRFGYSCASCGAKCCRGFGFQIEGQQETLRRLRANPALGTFLDLDPHSGGMYQVRNCPPGCFFLDEHGLCGVQVAEGYDAKPETCRFFPFNNFRRVAHHLVVAPHTSLCPLETMPLDTTSDKSDHERLFVEMARRGITAPVKECHPICADAAGLIALERRIVAATDTLPSSTIERSALTQLQLTEEIVGPEDDSRSSRQGADRRTDRLARFTAGVCAILGATPERDHAADNQVVQTLVAATPLIRSQLIFRNSAADAANAAVSVGRIPYVLLALHTIVALARETGMRRITYQTISHLFEEYYALLCVLAHADCEMSWQPAAPIEFPIEGDREMQRRYLAVAAALLPRAQRRTHAALDEIVCEYVPDGPDRMVFLKRLARRIAGRLQRVDSPNTARRQARRLRPAVQHWVLANLPMRVLIGAAQLKTEARGGTP